MFLILFIVVFEPIQYGNNFRVRYFLTIVDDYSKAVRVYLTTKKSEPGQLLVNFSMMAKWQYGKFAKCAQSHNGQECKSRMMLEFYWQEGMVHHTSCNAHPNKTIELNKNIDISLMLHGPFLFNLIFQLKFGETICWQSTPH